MTNIERIYNHIFDASQGADICKFYKKVWNHNAEYKVMMTRRAFNFNTALMNIFANTSVSTYSANNIISNNALLLCAKDIASYFISYRRFPSILICDDILVHGRGIMRLVNSLAKLLLQYVRNADYSISFIELEGELKKSILVYVYAQNRDTIIIDSSYSLRSMTYLPLNELRELSQKISYFLQNSGVANTSYVLSCKLDEYHLGQLFPEYNNLNSPYVYHYRGNNQLYYYRANSNVLETIRTNSSYEWRNPYSLLTSLVIVGNMSNNTFNAICNRIAEHFNNVLGNCRISEILVSPYEELSRPRAQMLSFILSLFSMVDFMREKLCSDSHVLYEYLIQSDYVKIAYNFSNELAFYTEFVHLFQEICFNNLRITPYTLFIMEHTDQIVGLEHTAMARFEQGFVSDKEQHYENIEDIFYEVGIDAEYDAFQYFKSKVPFNPEKESSDTIQLNQCLSLLKNKYDNIDNLIGCILGLMDSGLLSMNVENAKKGTGYIQCILKAGELSTYVIPRRLAVFIPALTIIERQCKRYRMNTISVIFDFIDYLCEHERTNNKALSSIDLKLLEKLYRSKKSLRYLYISGQCIEDWNTNILTDGDRVYSHLRQSSNEHTQLSYSDEKQLKEYYEYQARQFIFALNYNFEFEEG